MDEIKSVDDSDDMTTQTSEWHIRQQRTAAKWMQHRPCIFAGVLLSAAPSNDETCMICESAAVVRYSVICSATKYINFKAL